MQRPFNLTEKDLINVVFLSRFDTPGSIYCPYHGKLKKPFRFPWNTNIQ